MKGAAIAIGLLAATTIPASAATPCFTPSELRAAQLRQLQTELMVAALQCANRPNLGLPAKYNSFVRKFGGNLSENARILRGHFARNYGRDDARQFDSYITNLANEASMRSMATSSFCENSSPVFEAVLSLDTRELETFASRAVNGDAKPVCSGR